MHRTLLRQLKRTMGVANETALADALAQADDLARAPGTPPAVARLLAGFGELLGRIDGAYEQADRDIELRTRSLEVSSQELGEANEALRGQLASRSRALHSLNELVSKLTGTASPSGGDDLEALTQAVARLVDAHASGRRELDNQKFALDQHAVVSITDTAGRIVYANDKLCELSGYSREELIGASHDIVNSGFHPPEFFRDMWATIQGGRVWHGEIRNRNKQGGIYWVSATIVPFLDGEGRPYQYVAIRTDVTAQKEMEARIAASERRYRTVVENLEEAIFRASAGFRWTYINPAWEKITGFGAEQMLGDDIVHAVVPEDRARARDFLAGLAEKAGGGEIELRVRTTGDETRWIRMFVRPEPGEDGAAGGYFGTASDITERRLALERLEEQLHFVQELIEATPLPVYLKDADGRYMGFNRAFEELFGIERSQWIGRTVYDLMPDGEAADLHTTHDRELIRHGGSRSYETTITAGDGTQRYTIFRKAVLTRPDGGVTGLVGTVIDITDRKAAERAMMEAKEVAEAANRAKSEFLANMSHEIRTPMNGIIGMTDLVLDTSLTDEQREYLQIVKSSSESLLTVINDVLDFSKIEAGKLLIEHIPFDFTRLASDTLKTLALRAHQKRIELVCDVASDVPRQLSGDPGRLRQVLVNLVGNAIKFTEHGEVVVSAWMEPGESGIPTLHVAVRDTGIGIAPEKRAHIFEAFSQEDSSTTRRYGGTGLGLSISSRLVTLMGGRIWVDSEVGRGSTFHFTLALERCSGDAAPVRPVSLTGARVLIVEDNDANRRVLRAMLEKLGMVVTLAVNGDAGLAQMAGDAQRFDCVLLDAHMPEIDGFETARRMLALPACSGVPVIMLSSGAMRGDAQRCRELGLAGYFSKPISADELAAALTRVLSKEPDAPGPCTDIVTRHRLRDEQRRLNVLVVEDHPVNQKLVVTLLERWGHTVEVAANGHEGVMKFAPGRFDLILMDMQMPVMDGLEATRRIRVMESGADGGHTPIVAMTANAMQGDREACIAAGMDDYLSKPVKSQQLMEYLARLGATAGQ